MEVGIELRPEVTPEVNPLRPEVAPDANPLRPEVIPLRGLVDPPVALASRLLGLRGFTEAMAELIGFVGAELKGFTLANKLLGLRGLSEEMAELMGLVGAADAKGLRELSALVTVVPKVGVAGTELAPKSEPKNPSWVGLMVRERAATVSSKRVTALIMFLIYPVTPHILFESQDRSPLRSPLSPSQPVFR